MLGPWINPLEPLYLGLVVNFMAIWQTGAMGEAASFRQQGRHPEGQPIQRNHNPYIALKIFMEKAMAPHSSILAWKIPWMEEPGGLQSMGLLRVGHN